MLHAVFLKQLLVCLHGWRQLGVLVSFYPCMGHVTSAKGLPNTTPNFGKLLTMFCVL